MPGPATKPSQLTNPVPQTFDTSAQVEAQPIPASAPMPQSDPSGAPGTPMAGPAVGGLAQPDVSQKPAFDPSAPFQAVASTKPAFDPSQPFSAGGSEEGVRPLDNPDSGYFMKGLDAAGRALDYGGGFARGAIAKGIGAATGNDNLVTMEDLDNMAKGKGPSSAEYLKRMGVGEGLSVELPLVGKVTQRGVEGLALDIATDPLSLIGKAAKALPSFAPSAAKALESVTGLGADAAAKKIGEYIYRSGFSQIDAKMVENGSEPLSKLLLESGAPTGTTSRISEEIGKMSSKLGALRDGLYQKATDLGVKVDLGHPLVEAEGYANKLINDGRESVREQGQKLLEYLQKDFKNAGPVDIPTLSQWKTDLYNTLPSGFFGPNGRMTTVGKEFNAKLANDFRSAIVDAGNVAQKGLGDAIEGINSKWGTLLDSAKPVGKQITKAENAPIVSKMDAVIGAVSAPAATAKKALDVAGTTYVRTKAGKTLMNAGRSGVAGDVSRRALIDSVTGPQE